MNTSDAPRDCLLEVELIRGASPTRRRHNEHRRQIPRQGGTSRATSSCDASRTPLSSLQWPPRETVPDAALQRALAGRPPEPLRGSPLLHRRRLRRIRRCDPRPAGVESRTAAPRRSLDAMEVPESCRGGLPCPRSRADRGGVLRCSSSTGTAHDLDAVPRALDCDRR